jgi:hypothetical protein
MLRVLVVRPQRWAEVPGWFDWQAAIAEVVDELHDGARCVEVGVYMGRSTVCLADEIRLSGKQITLECFDIFDGSHGGPAGDGNPDPEARAQTVRDMLGAEVGGFTRVLVGRSPDCAAAYADRSLDFVWIDACHEAWGIEADIRGWWPKLKMGGLLGGHDFSEFFPGVVEVVTRLLGPHDCESRPPFSWLVRKRTPEL